MKSRSKLTLKSILLRNGNWWRFYEKYKDRIRPAIRDSILNLLSCGNTVRGFAEFTCSNPNCSHTKKIPFTCKNRSCSACGKKSTALWLHKQAHTFPDVPYQHITFTMPCELWDLFWLNRALFNIVGAIAANCVKEIAKKYGATPGLFIAIHSFGRDLKRNVHIHLCVTLGGLADNNTKWESLPNFKRSEIMPLWRASIIKLLRKFYKKDGLLLSNVHAAMQSNYKEFNKFLDYHYQRYWNVFCAPVENSYKHNIEYLARYIKRPSIANSRLLHYCSNGVKFWYFDHKTKTRRTFSCSVFEFIRRVIQHIPDKGFRLIRYYGFFTNALRGKLLPIVNELLNLTPSEPVGPITYSQLMQQSFNHNPLKCILCGSPLLLSNICFGVSQSKLLAFHKQLALMKPCR